MRKAIMAALLVLGLAAIITALPVLGPGSGSATAAKAEDCLDRHAKCVARCNSRESCQAKCDRALGRCVG
jgi:hypothetical protein